MNVGPGASLAWLAGALIGLVAALILLSWLPLLLKLIVIALIALALNLPGTPSSRGLQAGYLVSAGGVSLILLMMADRPVGPVAALAVGLLAIGLWGSRPFVGLRRSA